MTAMTTVVRTQWTRTRTLAAGGDGVCDDETGIMACSECGVVASLQIRICLFTLSAPTLYDCLGVINNDLFVTCRRIEGRKCCEVQASGQQVCPKSPEYKYVSTGMCRYFHEDPAATV
jgi:hypothetical protein